jgi:uncharacterized protein
MHLPDINVWIALAFPAHAHHQAARTWFDGTAEGCRLCRVTQMGFLRIANNPAALPGCAVNQAQAWRLYEHFLSHPRVGFAPEPAGLEPRWRELTSLPRHSPNVWSDAYLAAFADVGALELVTFDSGFAQYRLARCTILT